MSDISQAWGVLSSAVTDARPEAQSASVQAIASFDAISTVATAAVGFTNALAVVNTANHKAFLDAYEAARVAQSDYEWALKVYTGVAGGEQAIADALTARDLAQDTSEVLDVTWTVSRARTKDAIIYRDRIKEARTVAQKAASDLQEVETAINSPIPT